MSQAALPSVTPNAEKNQQPRQIPPRHTLLWCLAMLALAAVAFCAWALVYPSTVPTRIGEIVENLTGANPDPVILDRPRVVPLSAVAQLGEKIFFDPSLSASGKQSCATCHSPDHAFGPPNALSVQLGGATSMDITRPGVDKAYGIGKLKEVLGVPVKRMLFIGDALFPGGNDYPAKQAGAESIEVRDPQETMRVIQAIIACMEG